MNFTGQGTARDHAEALNWYRRAAEQSDVNAQYNLRAMYDQGVGVALSDAEALKRYRLAAEPQYKDAEKNRDMVARQMTPPRIAEAQKLVMEWKPGAGR